MFAIEANASELLRKVFDLKVSSSALADLISLFSERTLKVCSADMTK